MIPNGQRNYRGFDHDRHLRTRGIYGSIFTKNRNIEVLARNRTNIVFRVSNNIRNAIIQRSNELLPPRTSGLLIGILIRRKSRHITRCDGNIQIKQFSTSSCSVRSTCKLHGARADIFIK